MHRTREQVFIEALSLPRQARATLAHKLLLSLESEMGSPEIDAAWDKEALDRYKAFNEGKLTERDAEDVLRDAYKRLG